MTHIELHIKVRDWFIIFFIGLFISSVLSIFIYYLLDLNLLHGFIFGMTLGSLISLFSVLFISILNNHILPEVTQSYWVVLAVVFSFLSGFFGSTVTLVIGVLIEIDMIKKLEQNTLLFCSLIGVLTYFVGALMYTIVKMANLKEHNEQKLLQSRLKSLETQLNPHFLFNSLNSLAELIHVDKDKSEMLVLKLSEFLRNTMREKTLVSIEDEMKNLKAYIDIENIRFEDKISLDIECDNILKSVAIPKFSIQLIVENAIKHGFIQNDGIDISIKIFETDMVEIVISNNGKSIENKEFAIGLTNLEERLELLCDGKLEILDTQYPTYKISIGKKDENISSR